AAVCSRGNERAREVVAVLKFPDKAAVSLSYPSIFDEGRYDVVAVDRTSYVDQSSIRGRQRLSILRKFFTVTSERFSLLIDLQAEADLHVVEGFVSRVLYGVDDVPFAREVLRIGGVLLGFGCSNLLHFGLRLRFSNRGRL